MEDIHHSQSVDSLSLVGFCNVNFKWKQYPEHRDGLKFMVGSSLNLVINSFGWGRKSRSLTRRFLSADNVFKATRVSDGFFWPCPVTAAASMPAWRAPIVPGLRSGWPNERNASFYLSTRRYSSLSYFCTYIQQAGRASCHMTFLIYKRRTDKVRGINNPQVVGIAYVSKYVRMPRCWKIADEP